MPETLRTFRLAAGAMFALAVSASAEPRGLASVPTPRLDPADRAEMTALLLAARGATIVHTAGVPRPAPFASRVPCAIETRLARFECPVGSERAVELVKLLEVERLAESARQPKPTPCAKDSLPWARATLTFLTADETVDARVDLRSGQCRISWRGEAAPTTYLGSRVERLRQLLAEWMPEDTLLAEVRPCRRERGALALARPHAAVDDDEATREPPRFLAEEPLAYPPNALDLDEAVHVVGRARIGADGNLLEIVLVESHPLFDESVVRAIERSRFEPARRRGRPEESWLVLRFRFEPKPAWPAPYDGK